MVNLRAALEDLSIEVLELALRFEEGRRAKRDLFNEVKFNDIEVVRELLLEGEVFGDVGEGAGGAEGGAVFEAEVFLEVKGGDFAEAGDEGFALAGAGATFGGGVVGFFGGVVADVLEAVVRVCDGGEVGEEVGSGDVGGGFGG